MFRPLRRLGEGGELGEGEVLQRSISLEVALLYYLDDQIEESGSVGKTVVDQAVPAAFFILQPEEPESGLKLGHVGIEFAAEGLVGNLLRLEF